MSPELTDRTKKKIEEIASRYTIKEAALLPVLHLVQHEVGFISSQEEKQVAHLLDIKPIKVKEVVTFYTMYNQKPVGKYHIQLCRNITCWIKNAPGLLEYLKEKLGIEVGETSADGLFTLSEVECLAHCEYAPVIQVNDDIIGNITREKIDEIVANARK